MQPNDLRCCCYVAHSRNDFLGCRVCDNYVKSTLLHILYLHNSLIINAFQEILYEPSK